MNLLIITLLLFVFNLGLAQRPTSPPVKTCQPNPCMNNGTCYVTWGRARCRCRAGYVGLRCERETVCATRNPCQNGGRCYPSYSGGYRCRCQGDFGGRNCSEPNPCLSNPCQNGGACSSYKTWSSYWRLRCRCPSSHRGSRCEIENPCKNFECMNGGRCYSYGNASARCYCVNGFRGQHCEKASVCSTERPCKNGGSCYPTYNGNYRCRCQGGYGGQNCTESDPCNSNPCQNGGTCSSYNYRGWRLYCRCPKFYTGQKCEKASVCGTERPCKNGGSCYPTYNNNYRCRCQRGYGGQNCTDSDPCNSNPCQNGGTCSSYNYRGWRLYCRCPQFYIGQRCEKASVCAVDNPCKNGGTCYQGFNGGYRCRCQTGSGGRNCTESDPCSRNPCQNGGTCRSSKSWDSSWYQYCMCPRDYIGKNCETEDPCKSVACLNGGRCYSYGSTTARCSCYGGYRGPRCEQEDPCKRFTCLNGGRCYSYGSTTARCSCYGGYRGPRCGQEPCPISYAKCGMPSTPGPGDFDTCRKEIEESSKQRNSCFDRQIKDAIENKSCSCSESDFMVTLSAGLSSLQVLSVCSSRITFGQNVSRCDESTKECAELGLALVRNPALLTFCNQTLKTQIEGCMKKLDEGQLSFSGCGAYEYLIKEGSFMLYSPMLIKCYACNLTAVVLGCYSGMPRPGSSCKMIEGQNLNKTLDCFSTSLKGSCTAGSDWAVKGYIRYLNDNSRKLQGGCTKVSKHMEERAKWGCPTAAPTTPFPFVTQSPEFPV